MILKRNLLESVTLVSIAGTVLCILLHYVTNISPLTGVWFLIYLLTLFIVSLCLSIRFIQWLLHLNKPIKYDLDLLGSWNLPFLQGLLPQELQSESVECKEYDTNELSVISTVLERRLVSSWYVPYISEEIGFPFACKQLLDQMINKTFQICNKIETKDVYIDMCAILTTHLREYKKALKRHEKCPTSPIEELYKKSHPIFNSDDKQLTTADHCVNILRIILKELVPWELWDTPHSELLIRVLAKKLDIFINTTLCDPVWLNDKLFMILKGESEDSIPKDPALNTDDGEKKTVDDKVTKETTPPPDTKEESSEDAKPTAALSRVAEEEATEVQENMNSIEETAVGSEAVEMKPAAVLRQRRGRQGRNEVKIYDRIIEGSVKTWETDMDLQCISVGQDLLASLDEMTLSRLWGQEETEHSPNLRNRSPQPLWFGEEDSIDIEQPEPETREVKKESSPKPTEALLKDLQTTVHQAKTKIGDLQVPLDIDVPCKHSSDEAAGMMEGLFDIGLAGLKKGLRFTGLGDDSQEKPPSNQKERVDRLSPPDARAALARNAGESREGGPHAAHKEENGSAAPHLVKQPRVSSQDSVPVPIPREPSLPLSESPEPEYEEVADLSTSIARLRSLLQETAQARSDDIWWEGAEETRGRTHHPAHALSRPIDSAALADEYDMNGAPDSPRQATNNMQRLDRLFQRTVTGMFNSIKTAVSAEEALAPPAAAADWAYVAADSADNCVGGAVARLLSARRSLWRVDAALDSLQPPRAPPPPPPPPPDDFEEWCAGPGAVWSAGGEACSAAGLARRHVAYRLAALLLADVGEAVISRALSRLSAWLRAQVFVSFARLDRAPPAGAPCRELRPDETVQLILDNMPGKFVFGSEAVRAAAALLVDSFSRAPLNRDVALRALDLLAARWKAAAALRHADLDN